MTFRPVAALLALAALVASAPAGAEERRFALVVGDSDGGAGTRPLRFAERDAKRIHGILTRLGGVLPERLQPLVAATADLSDRFRSAGHRLYLVGGSVRDAVAALDGRVVMSGLKG